MPTTCIDLPDTTGQYLSGQRVKLKPPPDDNAIALLVALKDATLSRREDTPQNRCFRDSCFQVFRDSEAFFPDLENPEHPDALACAWYNSATSSVLDTAIAIRDALEQCSVMSENLIRIAVGRHEYAAFRLLRDFGEPQIIVDPIVWKRFVVDEKMAQQLIAQNVNQPDVESLSKAIEMMTEGAIEIVLKNDHSHVPTNT